MSNNLAPIIEQLRSAYLQLADLLFPGMEMPMPVIHVPHKDSRRKGMSWYKPEAWQSSETDVLNILAGIGGKEGEVASLAEIAIAAEGLDRPLNTILADLLHEMVHHANFERHRPDLGKSRHHNHWFDQLRAQVGLAFNDANYTEAVPNAVYMSRYSGDSHKALREMFPDPNDGNRGYWVNISDVFDKLAIDRDVFDLSRLATTKRQRPGSKLLKYSCGCTNARVATSFKATCLQCGNDFEGPL